jgi:hypothetical protein
MPLTFSDFSPISFGFEIRYPDAYLLWDHAGQMTEELKSRYEITRRVAAEPLRIAFVVRGTQEVTWQLDKLIIVDYQPLSSKFDSFYRLCSDCFELTVRNLGVSELKRVGFRPIFAKKYLNKDDAGAALLSAGLIHVPMGKALNIEPGRRYPEYAIRCEDDKFGYMLRLGVQEVNYELEPSPQWRGNVVEPKHETI